MSQENVEIVQRLVAGFNRRDDDWQAVLAELDPNVRIDDRDISLDTTHFLGHDGARKWLGIWGDAWGGWRIENLKVRPVGKDRALGLFVMYVAGKGSGIELSRPDAMVFTLRAGKVTELTYYNDQDQALEAAGLSE